MSSKTPKLGRLTKRSEFLFVRDGHYAARPHLVVQARNREDGSPDMRFGVTATKKVGGAVVRNRCKRRMRELARAFLPRLGRPGFDYVFIARDSTAKAEFTALQRDTEKALEKVARPRHNPRNSD